MRGKVAVVTALGLMFCGVSIIAAGETEQDIINRYLKKAEAKHTKKITWMSANFTFNRINRYNDYNKFATHNSSLFSNVDIPWLGDGKSFGAEAGMLLGERLTWSIGGEYWLMMGINRTGSFNYLPLGGSPAVINNLVSEVQVWGVTSTIQYYLLNPPTKDDLLSRFALRIGGGIGYYHSSWNLWDSYENLNLATSAPEGGNATFQGSAPGFSMHVGADYPLPFSNMAVGVDIGYLYLNFPKVAWYNATGEEIVATYNDTPDSRVKLGLSGFQGKIELKRFFKF